MGAIIGHHGLLLGGGASGVDPYFASVVALLNMAGADASTTFTDSTGLRVWTPAGNAQIDTSNGYNAAQFDGTGDYITTPYVTSAFDWWTGDFCIEAWVLASSWTTWGYTDGSARPAMIGCADPATTTAYWAFGPTAAGVLQFNYFNGATFAHTGGSVPTGTLTHIAFTHSAATNLQYLSVAGTTVTNSVAVSGTPQSSATSPVKLTLGMINNRSINGFVKALRITKATRGYTSNFTPPAAPFPTS